MFVSDKLVYLQMQKTASTHIAKTLAAVVGGEQFVQHQHLAIDPGGRLVVASIRNPFSWYVSLWAYGCRGGGGEHGLYNRVTAAPPTPAEIVTRSISFARAKRKLPTPVVREARELRARQRSTRTDLWRRVYTNPDDVVAFRGWLNLVFDAERAREMPGRYGETPLRFHGGLMTFRYLRILADDATRLMEPGVLASLESVRAFDRDHTVHDDMIKTECLEPDLLRVLTRAGYDLTPRQLAELSDRCRQKTNASPHLRDRDYYDDEALELVATRERFLIEKYGYAPPE